MFTTSLILTYVAISMFTSLIIVWFVYTTLRAKRSTLQGRTQILMKGVPAKAFIHAVHPTSSSMDGQPGVTLELTVTQQDGRTFPAMIKTFIPIIHIPQFQKGKEIDVKYLEIGDERRVEVVGAYVP
ncbi:hypothetical protein [Paenibacillus sp. FSL K6-1230]|uniref:hypothetical protein n=1 Tax=Paenibacillus sp. FSL K6-1230 TaxID=2921603 RepID=UPI00039D6113